MGLTNPNIETVLNSPLFGTQGMLRAATSTPISIQPDSMNINLSEVDINGIPATVKPMLANIKLKFADYKDYTMTTANGQTIEISVPLKVTASALDGFISCGVNFSVGEKKGLLPFSSFTANLDLGDLEALLTSLGMTNIKSGTLVSMTETGSNAVYNYDINSKSEPDFIDAGIELKVTPYKKNKDNTLSAKERLVLNIINYMTEYQKSFYTSHFWFKNNKIERI